MYMRLPWNGMKTIFRHFDHIYFSVSGERTAPLCELAAQAARRLGKKLSVLYIDLEAQYQATITHVEELIQCNEGCDRALVLWWRCRCPSETPPPPSARSGSAGIKRIGTSGCALFPDRDDVCLITEDHYPKEWTWFRRGMEFEEFILYFCQMVFRQPRRPAAAGIGIRSDESLNRFRTIISNTKERYLDYPWTTGSKSMTSPRTAGTSIPSTTGRRR